MTKWRNGLQGKAMIGLGSDKKQMLKTIHSTARLEGIFCPIYFSPVHHSILTQF